MPPRDAGAVRHEALERSAPLVICLLGSFRLLKASQPLDLRGGGKRLALLVHLALHHRQGVSRDQLLEWLWPGIDSVLAGQSLNSLVYSLHKLLGNALAGAAPVVQAGGRYRLNFEAGVEVDVAAFDALWEAAARRERAGDPAGASAARRGAVALYRGDLCAGGDLQAVIERERLRAHFLTLLAHLADEAFAAADYPTCLDHALRLLGYDPCREDAHRLVMRCYVRLGERAQALHQYRLCEAMLRSEFQATPEPATTELFDRIRLAPEHV